MNSDVTHLKMQAAHRAVELVESGMVVGLGHGSTAIHGVRRLAELLQKGQLRDILGIPVSTVIQEEAQKLGLHLVTLEDHPFVDLTFDGADEVDASLAAIVDGVGLDVRCGVGGGVDPSAETHAAAAEGPLGGALSGEDVGKEGNLIGEFAPEGGHGTETR